MKEIIKDVNPTVKVKEKIKSNKVLSVVALRNKFFFIFYRYSSLVFLTSLATFVMSVSFFIFFSNQPVPPQYIAINEDGTYIKLTPISDCATKSESEVKQFALNGIKKIYKYDYINYAEQLQDAAQFFSTEGWNEFLESYKSSNTLLAVKENKWIVTVDTEGAPELVKNPYIDNKEQACTWELKIPLSLSYIGTKSQTNKGDAYLRISRVSVLKNMNGLGIKKIFFIPK